MEAQAAPSSLMEPLVPTSRVCDHKQGLDVLLLSTLLKPVAGFIKLFPRLLRE